VKIGILSDTHDNLPKIEKAVTFFNKHKVGLVLHAGDYVAPFTIPKFKMLACDWRGVFGNNDGERDGLKRISAGRIKEGPLRIKLGNKKIVLVHDINKINPKAEKADLIIFGHTHKAKILKQDSLLIVNPGECGGWLTGDSTVALADLDSSSSRIFKI
jgi:putative phosphoesterase